MQWEGCGLDEAIEYAMNKFHSLGVAVSDKEIEAVLNFVDEYYERIADDYDASVIVYTDEQRRQYIKDNMPGIPHNIIDGVLDKEQEFYMSEAGGEVND